MEQKKVAMVVPQITPGGPYCLTSKMEAVRLTTTMINARGTWNFIWFKPLSNIAILASIQFATAQTAKADKSANEISK